MSNIFHCTPVYHFQMPHHIFDTSIWAELKSVSKNMYCFILHVANRKSSNTFALSDADIMNGTRLSDKSLSAAREELKKFGLVKCTRIRVGFQYEILDPSIGDSLEKIDDFNRASETALRDFFLYHLRDREVSNDFNGLRTRCPFCNAGKPSLVMSVKDGGPWVCNNRRCKARGKLVEFELRMAELKGETISSTEAHHRARHTLIRVTKNADERLQKEVNHALAVA